MQSILTLYHRDMNVEINPVVPNGGVPIDYNLDSNDVLREFIAYEERIEPYIVHTGTVETNPSEVTQFLLVHGDFENAEKYLDWNNVRVDTERAEHKRYYRSNTEALRLFLSWCEQAGMNENDVLAELMKHDWCWEAEQEIESEDREMRYESELEQLNREYEPYVDTVETEGRRWTVDHSREIDRYSDNRESISCYRIALEMANEHDELKYVEGIAGQKYGGYRLHAWNVMEDDVLDFTWDWTGVIPPCKSIYHGVQIPLREVGEIVQYGEEPPFLMKEADDVISVF